MSVSQLMKDLDADLKRRGTDRVPRVSRAGDHSLRRKLLIGMAIAIICTGALGANIIIRSSDDYQLARINREEVNNYRIILDAANILSAERGPSNSLLGADILSDDPLHARLAQFRARSDAALDGLARHSSNKQPIVPVKLIEPIRQQLQIARQMVDHTSALPRSQRALEEVQRAIDNSIKVVDIFQSAIRWKVNTLSASNPQLSATLLMGQILGDLRECGGRLGSQIMAPIAVRQKLPLKNLIESNLTRGRLTEIWNLIGGPDAIRYHDPRLTAVLHDVADQFFKEGIGITDTLVSEGRLSGLYSMTSTEYTNALVQTLAPLEKLRSTYLDLTIEKVSAEQREALIKFILAIVVTVVILATMAGLVIVAQNYVFDPLLRAREEVIALAEDRPIEHRGAPRYSSELGSLFDAINILKRNLKERASLTRQLKQQAETDGLTGLMNRRTLDLIGESQTSNQVMTNGACLMLMDIDHFKSINDTYGHLAGDQVLNEIVCLTRSMLRTNDIFARFGGEEFVVLIPNDDLYACVAMATRIREAIEMHTIRFDDGQELKISASFGVSKGYLGRHAWPRLIEAADKALYRAKAEGRNCVRYASEIDHSISTADDSDITPLAAAG